MNKYKALLFLGVSASSLLATSEQETMEINQFITSFAHGDAINKLPKEERKDAKEIEKSLTKEQIRFATASYLEHMKPAECTPAIKKYLIAVRNALVKAAAKHENIIIPDLIPQNPTFFDDVGALNFLLNIKFFTSQELRTLESKYLDAPSLKMITRYYDHGKRAYIGVLYLGSIVARVSN